mgnify:CR=1 FL=1
MDVARRLTDEETVPVMEAAGLTPLEPYPGNGGRPWSCLCHECGGEVTPSYESIKRGRGGCKFCAAERRASARRIPQEEAASVMIDAGLTPLEPTSPTVGQTLR